MLEYLEIKTVYYVKTTACSR